ncbi:hypothetical protein C8R45DRAFT_1090660 [Mycena sanguinolenta]|nr:hypothetical protein C8R45DRAFT_1090660 [Mycena sanguinolenta]
MRPLNLTSGSPSFYLNTFAVGVGTTRTRLPTIEQGILVEPHATGVRAVLGVPNLPPDRSISIDNTMLIEVDIGCMELGLFTQMDLDVRLDAFDVFATNWKNNYTGPEVTRSLFNESSKDDGGLLQSFETGLPPLGGISEETAQISRFYLPFSIEVNDPNVTDTMFMNCTADVYRLLNITLLDEYAGFTSDYQCGMFGVVDSFVQDGIAMAGISRFFCATAVQANMASVTIITDADAAISATYIRMPSDLNYVVANWWDIVSANGTDNWINYAPFERFVLSSSDTSHQTNHYIAQYERDFFVGGARTSGGPVSAGSLISRLGSDMMNWDFDLDHDTGMSILEDGTNNINFNASIVPAWGGKVAGALIRNSLKYNGFAALQAPPTLVSSTGGKAAICYDLRYGVAIVPLFVGAAVAIAWSAFILATTAFKGVGAVKKSYGGLEPLRVTLCPKWAVKDSILAWQNVPEPHLEAVLDEDSYSKHEAASAAQYLSKVPEVDHAYVDH